MLSHAPPQRHARQAEQLGGLIAIAGGPRERGGDATGLGWALGGRRADLGGREHRLGVEPGLDQFGGQIARDQLRALADRERVLERVAELANVARPIVVLERCQGGGREL